MYNFPSKSISRSSTSTHLSETEMDDSRPSGTTTKSSSFSFLEHDHYQVTREKNSFFTKFKYSSPRGRYGKDVEIKHKLDSVSTLQRSNDIELDYRWCREARTFNIKSGIAALVKGCVGGGMVCLHVSYNACGMLSALLLNILFGCLISYCMYEMARSCKKIYDRTNISIVSYPDLIEIVCDYSGRPILQHYSRTLRHVVEFLMCVDLFGSCSVYQVMVARSVFQIIEGPDGEATLNFEIVRLYISLLIVPFSMLGVFVRMDHLAPFSITLNFFIVMLSLSTVYYAFFEKKSIVNPLDLPVYQSFGGMCELVGNTLFAIDGITATLAVEKNIKNPNDFPMVVLGGMPIVMALGIIIGTFGNWGWGNLGLSPITLNFPWTSFAIPLKLFTILVMYVTFGMTFWVPANMVWYYASYYHDSATHYLDEKVWRFGLVLMTIVVAAALPNITKFLALLGCFSLSMLTFVFPALVSLLLDWEKPGFGKYYWRVWRAGIFVVMGLIIFFVGTIVNAFYLFYHIALKLNH